jgi:Fe-S oxidoreductase
MLELQRKKARTAGRLMAEGLSKDEARKLARENSENFRPAFVQGRRRTLVESHQVVSVSAPDEVSAGPEM